MESKSIGRKGGVINLLFLLIFLIIITVGGLIVVNTLQEQYIGSFYYLWRAAEDNSFINGSGGSLNLSLQRIATDYGATLKVTFTGGLGIENVSVSGVVVGNLSGASPKSLSVAADTLEVTTPVDYELNGSTNISLTNISYYSYDGCNYDQDTCMALDTSRAVNKPLWYVNPLFIMVIAFISILLAGLMVGKKI